MYCVARVGITAGRVAWSLPSRTLEPGGRCIAFNGGERAKGRGKNFRLFGCDSQARAMDRRALYGAPGTILQVETRWKLYAVQWYDLLRFDVFLVHKRSGRAKTSRSSNCTCRGDGSGIWGPVS